MLLANLQKAKKTAKKPEHKTFLQRMKDQVEPTNELVRLLFSDYADWVGLLHNATEEGMSKVFEQAGKIAIEEVAADVTFDLSNPRAMDYLNEHALENATSYSDTMKEDITLNVMQGVENGASVDEIAAGIGEFFDQQGDYRAERLARTETVDAYAQGNLEGYRQSGVVSGKEWLFDGGTCESSICPDNVSDGVIDIDATFSSGDDAPPAHPNCECALQPVVVGDIND